MRKNTTKLFITTIILGLITTLPVSADITGNFMEGDSFETVMDIGNIKSIETWEQPKTQYTPKNLVSEQQVRYSGTDKNGRGSYSYTQHFTDYDTKITGSYIQDDKYFIKDNLGRSYQTGERVDLTPINNQINNQNVLIQNNTNRINNLDQRITDTQRSVNKLDNKLEGGLATVTALTSLHPNPRFTGKTEVSVGMGIYADNVAGAVGIFHHFNDRVMMNVAASYGGEDQWAGSCGITFGLGRRNK